MSVEIPIYFENKKCVEFEIEGKPFGKQRPRVINRGGFSTTYTPKQTVDYENKVKKSYKNTVGNTKLNNAIRTEIIGIFPIPKNTSKKMKSLMLKNQIKHTKKIDCDNMAKTVLDALNNIAYNDDSQICELYIKKRYGENPKVKVKLEEI